MQPEYTPGATPAEVLAHGHLAAQYDVPLCLHARFSDNVEPGLQADAMTEVVNVARETGAWVHVEHINSTGGTGRMADALATLEAGRDEGLRISACIYPYTFWATYLRSARYNDWQAKYGISYSDLQIAGTADRLTEQTYQQAFEDNRLTAAFAIPEDDIVLAMQANWVMLGSDAILEPPHNNHPRSTGCFAKMLGTYVRDRQVISLVDGLAKCTILPAQLLGLGAPAMRRKGRLQIGADADITVFDPHTIADRSTIEDPAQESVGVDYVLVDGTVVKTPDGIVRSARPGTAITSSLV
jgi:N-acyl-D-aspartate/D-glutamate deacylase